MYGGVVTAGHSDSHSQINTNICTNTHTDPLQDTLELSSSAEREKVCMWGCSRVWRSLNHNKTNAYTHIRTDHLQDTHESELS